MISSRRTGFTLIEVAIALTIATGGVILLYQGITLALRAEEHRRVYERATRFLDKDFGRIVESVASGNGVSGDLPGPGQVVNYTVFPRILDDPPGVLELEVAFQSQDPRLPDIPGFKTHFVPNLRARKAATSTTGDGS